MVDGGDDPLFSSSTGSPISDPFETEPSPVDDDEAAKNQTVIIVLVVLITVLFLLLMAMIAPSIYVCLRRKIPVSRKRLQRRYATIESWMISKRVKEHDACCDRVHEAFLARDEEEGEASEPPCVIKANKTFDTIDDSLGGDDEAEECPICMEPFAPGEVVSWSSNLKCGHVFHHECIKEWLLRHVNCPFCRELFLPVDVPDRRKLTKKEIKALGVVRCRRASTTYYCVKEGLVTVNSSIDGTQEDIDLIKEKTCSYVKRGVLPKMRGSRMETTDVGAIEVGSSHGSDSTSTISSHVAAPLSGSSVESCALVEEVSGHDDQGGIVFAGDDAMEDTDHS